MTCKYKEYKRCHIDGAVCYEGLEYFDYTKCKRSQNVKREVEKWQR